MIVIQSHELAEQITKATPLFKYSVPKSATQDVLISVVGKKSMILLNDEPWKNIRKQFNAGLCTKQPGHLLAADHRQVQNFSRRTRCICEVGS
jgi:cytochrome P450